MNCKTPVLGTVVAGRESQDAVSGSDREVSLVYRVGCNALGEGNKAVLVGEIRGYIGIILVGYIDRENLVGICAVKRVDFYLVVVAEEIFVKIIVELLEHGAERRCTHVVTVKDQVAVVGQLLFAAVIGEDRA